MPADQENSIPVEVKRMLPLLTVDKVQAGDVLLTRGRGVRSSAIATVTNGAFSHASIWLTLGEYGGTVLAEADGFGVGFTPIVPIHLEDDNKVSQALAYSLPGSPSRYVLMRHPDIVSVSQQRISAATKKLQETAFLKKYSSLPRLVDAVDLPAPISATARSVLSFVEMLQGGVVDSGAFCSELVAIFFAEIGLPLFIENRSATQISPNHLASSLLFEVSDAFIEPNQISEKWRIRGDLVEPMFSRSTFLPFTIRRIEQANHIHQVADSIKATLEKSLSQNEQDANFLHIDMQRLIQDAAAQSEAMGDLARGARMRELALRLHILSFLRTAVYHQGVLINQEGGSKEIESWGVASVELIRLWQTLVSSVERAFQRTQLLSALSIIRRVRASTRSPLKRYQLYLRRKSFVRQWQNDCRKRAPNRKESQDFLYGPDMDELSLYYIDLTIAIAGRKALNELLPT